MKSIQKRVVDTYHSPCGLVVVIINVPAVVFVDAQGREEVLYDFDVAAQLDALTQKALSSCVDGSSRKEVTYDFDVTPLEEKSK